LSADFEVDAGFPFEVVFGLVDQPPKSKATDKRVRPTQKSIQHPYKSDQSGSSGISIGSLAGCFFREGFFAALGWLKVPAL
jgi:hypothetical protein